MSTVDPPATVHGTLVADEITEVTVAGGGRGVVVVNRTLDGGPMWVRVDGEDPEPAGEGTYVVLGAREFVMRRFIPQVSVKLLSADARDFSVEAMS